MATKAQKVRLSIFLIVTSTIFLVFFVVLIGNRLLARTNTYTIIYEDISVTGLESGAAVKYHGVQVGRVIGLGVHDAASVFIEIEVEADTPVKEDTEAILTLVGITGLKFVELIGGSEESPLLPNRSTITAGQSLFDSISGSAEVLLAKLEQVLNNINDLTSPETVGALNRMITSAAELTEESQQFMADNREPLTETITDLRVVMNNLNTTTARLDSTMVAVNDLIRSDEVQGTVADIHYITAEVRAGVDSLQLDETAADLQELLANANRLVVNYDYIGQRARDDILSSLRSLEETLENLREATDVIRENPSVLIRGRRTAGDRIE